MPRKLQLCEKVKKYEDDERPIEKINIILTWEVRESNEFCCGFANNTIWVKTCCSFVNNTIESWGYLRF